MTYLPYSEIVNIIAMTTGLYKKDIRKILAALPHALRQLPEDYRVKTPLGVFKTALKRARTWRLPGTDTIVAAEESLVVRLKPGHQLRKPRPKH